jgi:hypothetical protein
MRVRRCPRVWTRRTWGRAARLRPVTAPRSNRARRRLPRARGGRRGPDVRPPNPSLATPDSSRNSLRNGRRLSHKPVHKTGTLISRGTTVLSRSRLAPHGGTRASFRLNSGVSVPPFGPQPLPTRLSDSLDELRASRAPMSRSCLPGQSTREPSGRPHARSSSRAVLPWVGFGGTPGPRGPLGGGDRGLSRRRQPRSRARRRIRRSTRSTTRWPGGPRIPRGHHRRGSPRRRSHRQDRRAHLRGLAVASARSRWRSSRRRIFPVTVLGSSSSTSTRRGYL